MLFCHLGQILEYAEYIKAFKKISSIQTLLLTMGQNEYRLGLEAGEFDTVKDILPSSADLERAASEYPAICQSLRDLENRIGVNFVNRDILGDRFFRTQPAVDVDSSKVPLVWTGLRTRQFMRLLFQRLEVEIDSFAPEFIFVETSFAPTRMAWRLASERGIPAGGFMSVRFWPDRMYFESGIGYDWYEARSAYAALVDQPLAGDELRAVQERLETIRAHKAKPAYLKTEHAKGAPNFWKRLRAVSLFSGQGGWLGARARTFTTNPQVLPPQVFSPRAKYLRYRKGRDAKRYLLEHQTAFSEFKGKNYVVFFLHVQPEITVEGMAFEYQDQVSTLSNVLAALPANMHLVVKEHSPMLGFRQLGFYDQLLRMPGLIIAETSEDSHDLISSAVAVVTLTGTVALEAILYGVPAIVLGSIYFDSFAGIYKAESLNALKSLLADPTRLQGANESDALRALASLHRASRPGNPARVDVSSAAIDSASAIMMVSELKRVQRGVRRDM